MDTRHSGFAGQAGSADPQPAPGGGQPFPAHWIVDRCLDGSWRVGPGSLPFVRLAGIALLVGLGYCTIKYLDLWREPLGMVLTGVVIVPLILLIATWSDEWIVRRGRLEVRSRRIGFWRSRTFTQGRFSVESKFKENGPNATVRSKVLKLSTGLETLTLSGLELDEGTKELNAMAAWLGEQTGWPVFLANVPDEPLETPELPEPAMSAGVREDSLQSATTAPYEPGVAPALPEAWSAKMQPDGGWRLIPNFRKTQALLPSAVVLLVVVIVVSVSGLDMILEFWPFLVLLAVIGLLVLASGEAWVLDRGRFEVHRRWCGVWKSRRYHRGVIFVRPRSSSAPKAAGSVPTAIYCAWFFLSAAAYNYVIAPGIDRGWWDQEIIIPVSVVWLVVPAIGYVLYQRVFGRTALIEAYSKLFLRVARPGSGKPEVVDLMAGASHGSEDPGWVPSVDELRALAAWLSQQTGWPVQEIP